MFSNTTPEEKPVYFTFQVKVVSVSFAVRYHNLWTDINVKSTVVVSFDLSFAILDISHIKPYIKSIKSI